MKRSDLAFLKKASWILCFISITLFYSSCNKSKGDNNDYTEMTIEEITEKNIPKGLMLRDGKLYPMEGYELVQSKDSTRVMLLQIGEDKGQTEGRCKCQNDAGWICYPMKYIIGCEKLECEKCEPLLIVYDNPKTIDRSNW